MVDISSCELRRLSISLAPSRVSQTSLALGHVFSLTLRQQQDTSMSHDKNSSEVSLSKEKPTRERLNDRQSQEYDTILDPELDKMFPSYHPSLEPFGRSSAFPLQNLQTRRPSSIPIYNTPGANAPDQLSLSGVNSGIQYTSEIIFCGRSIHRGSLFP